MTVLAWGTATFWFPVMIALGVWRHVINGVPVHYHPSYWGLVFPSGMYGVSTHKMIAAIDLDALEWLTVLALGGALVTSALSPSAWCIIS